MNACVSRYLQLRLDGQDLELLGIDLPLGGRAQRVEEVLLAPGNRADLLITTRAGTSTLQALPYDRGTAMGRAVAWAPRALVRGGSVTELMMLVVAGAPAPTVAALSPRPAVSGSARRRGQHSAHPHSRNGNGHGNDGHGLRRIGVHHRRTQLRPRPRRPHRRIRCRRGMDDHQHLQMDHPFHLHVWPMQVLTVAGRAIDEPTWQNVVNVPAGGSTVVRIASRRTPAAPSTTATSSTTRTTA